MTFESYVSGPFEHHFLPTLRPSTSERYRALSRQRLLGFSGLKPIDAIELADIRAFAAEVAKDGVMLKGPVALVCTILRTAHELGFRGEPPKLPRGFLKRHRLCARRRCTRGEGPRSLAHPVRRRGAIMSLAKRYKKRGVYVWCIDIPAKLAGKRFLRRAKGQVRSLAEQEAQRILARLVAGKHPYDDEPVGPAITIAEFVGEEGKYTLLYRPSLKPSTARRYADLDRQFILPEFGDVPLDKIDVPMILRAHAALKVRGVVPKGPLAYLRRLLHAAVECGELREAPTFPKGLIVQAEKLPACPSDNEVERMKATATPTWLPTAIFLAVYAGLRSGEVRALRVGDVDLEGGVIHVRVAMSEGVETVPKSKHSIRDVPIAAPLLPVLRAACAGKLPLARVVTNGHGGTPSRTHLLTVFVALQKRLGFAKLWSFHSLRHYFCTTLVRRGVAVSAVQVLAGHENIKVTDRYTHATREDLRAGIATFGK